MTPSSLASGLDVGMVGTHPQSGGHAPVYNPPMPSTDTTAEALAGSIERVTFHNPDSGFAVLRLKVKGRSELVSVVGHLPSAAAGEYVEAEGWWVIDKEHGQQFKATTMRTTHPSSPEGIEKYLGSGFIKGIGPHFAKKLVQTFGEQVFEVIEKQPERLTEVRGIGATRQERITKSWHDQRVVREIMVFLQGHGVGTARAVRIYKTYGDDAIGIVKQNPYRLAYDIKGIGFKTADELAGRLGVDKSSPLRARAGVGYALQQLTTEGHCAFPEEGLVKKAVELLGIEEAIIRAAIDHEIGEGRLVRDQIGEDDLHLPGRPVSRGDATRRSHQETGGGQASASRDRHREGPGLGGEAGRASTGPGTTGCRGTGRHIESPDHHGRTRGGQDDHRQQHPEDLHRQAAPLRPVRPNRTGGKKNDRSDGLRGEDHPSPAGIRSRELRLQTQRRQPAGGDLVLVDEVSMMDLPLAYSLVQAVPDNAAVDSRR